MGSSHYPNEIIVYVSASYWVVAFPLIGWIPTALLTSPRLIVSTGGITNGATGSCIRTSAGRARKQV